MKKWTIFLCTAVWLVFALAGRSSPASAETVVLFALDWPPYEIENPTNGLPGTDLEVEEEAFKRVGISVRYEFMPWARQFNLGKLGKVAGLTVCAYRPEREEFFLFSDTVSHGTDGFMMRRDFDGPELKTLEEARGLSVGGVTEFSSMKILQEVIPDAKGFRSDRVALLNLRKGIVDYIYVPIEASAYIAKQMGISEELKFTEIKVRDYYICFSKKWPGVEDLVAKFNKGLAEIKADGTYNTIHDKYR